MATYDTRPFLFNLKLIYNHGVSHSKKISKVNLMLAIHNYHYVVEQVIKDKAKDMDFKAALHEISFAEIIERVHPKQSIPDYGRLLELNSIRNNAEHLFIVPESDTVKFYGRIVEDFLKWSYKNYFGVDYGSLALEDYIYDVPIKKAMFEARDFIERNDLSNASKKMYESLGAFKFMWFRYLSDPRAYGHDISGVTLSNVLADLAFKIILGEDESTLARMMSIGTDFFKTPEGIGVKSVYPTPPFKDKEEATQHYEDILNIILTYQDRVPSHLWRR